MKKPHKSVETSSIRIYVNVVKRLLLNNLCGLLILGWAAAIGQALAANNPCLLILKDGANLISEASALESQGALVRQRVPPSIVIVELPDTLNPAGLKSVQEHYFGVIPISRLQPLGPTAVAAGLKWNRTVLNRPARADFGTQSMMRTMAAQSSLPAPLEVDIKEEQGALRCRWKPLAGALLYRVQASLDREFSKPYCDTHTNVPSVDLPLPQGEGPLTVWVRVQGMDYPDSATQEELYGPWANAMINAATALPKDASLPALLPTSPVDQFKSEGSSLVLEWKTDLEGRTRVQISGSASFETMAVDQMAGEGEFVCPSPALKFGHVYFWRIKTYGQKQSSWSQARRFEIGEPHHAQKDMFVNPEAPQ